jgi:hypothetical protein
MDAAMDGVGRAGQSRIQEFKNSRSPVEEAF